MDAQEFGSSLDKTNISIISVSISPRLSSLFKNIEFISCLYVDTISKKGLYKTLLNS